MRIPRILVIDDQYARDAEERAIFVRHTELLEAEGAVATASNHEAVGVVSFCSGQRVRGRRVVNDYEVVKSAVAQGGEEHAWSMVLLDVRFESGAQGGDGVPAGAAGDDEFGENVRTRLSVDFPGLPVVMLSGKGQQDLRDRETPYLSKEGLDRRGITSALLRFGSLNPAQARRLLALPENIVAASEKMLHVLVLAFDYSASDASVLVLGESGVGKEVVARYIHQRSQRSAGPFIARNIAALPRELVESELFGHEAGAFTGAIKSRQGLFQQAEGGTLFLDEIGDMPVEAQTKVLRVLQERHVYRVGGRQAEPVNIRLISATSRDLPARIAAGQFREDLYYRINALPLEILPLRERSEEVPALCDFLLRRFMELEGKKGIELSPGAMAEFGGHHFPGNVRELENLLQRLLAGTGNNRVISAQEVASVLAPGRASASPSRSPAGESLARPAGRTERPHLALAEFPSLLAKMEVDPADSALAGAKPRVEEAVRQLLLRLAGAALERCRDPISGEFNRQRAMQLLTGDEKLKNKGPARVINRLLGRNQDDEVEKEDLEELVRAWRTSREGRE